MLKKWLGICACVGFGLSPAWAAEKANRDYTYVFAHYMTWFETPEANGKWGFWNWETQPHRRDPERIFPNGRRDIASVTYPLIGPYSSTDEAVAEYHILLAKAAGIDGFVVNWYGFADGDNKPRAENAGLGVLLKAAERLNFWVCIDLDDKSMFPPYTRTPDRAASVELAAAALKRVAREYAVSPAYFKINQQPVLTNFGWGPPFAAGQKAVSFSPEEWKSILAPEGGGDFFFIADHQWHWGKDIFQAGFLEVAQSVYPWVTGDADARLKFYADSEKAVQLKRMKFVSGEAFPGFDNWGTWGWGGGRVVIDRDRGRLYRKTWKESLQAQARWIQLITWNDFAEGTNLEPTEEDGYRYLEITAEHTRRLGHARADKSALPLAKAIYDARVSARRAPGNTPAAAAWKKALDQAVEEFLRGNYPACRALVKRTALIIKNRETQPPPNQPAVKITLSPAAAQMRPGEKTELMVTLASNTTQAFSGQLVLDSGGAWPAAWVSPAVVPVQLAPGQVQKYAFGASVPRDTPAQTVLLEAQLHDGQDEALFRSRVAQANILPLEFHLWVEGCRLLVPGKPGVLRVRVQARQKSADKGNILLEVPSGWKAAPSRAGFQLPAQGSAEVDFHVTIPKPERGQIHFVLNSRLQGRQELAQTLLASEPQQVACFREDLNHDGVEEYVLGNDSVEIQVATGLGGRILAFYTRPSGHNQLYLAYPDAATLAQGASQDWAEYGGISDTFPALWPGEVWNNTWEGRVEEDASDAKTLLFSCQISRGLKFVRHLRLTRKYAGLMVYNDIQNLADAPQEVSWSNHPDLSPGGGTASSAQVAIIPTAQGQLREPFAPTKTKSQIVPAADWCLALDTRSGEYLAQRFDVSANLQIGVYKGERFFTMELMPAPFTLKPQEHWQLRVDYLAGRGDWQEQLGLKNAPKP